MSTILSTLMLLVLTTSVVNAQTTDEGKQRIVKSGIITADETWTSEAQYFLDGRVYVDAGVTLTIDPGVVIKGRFDTDVNNVGVLVIQAGAKIMAEGTLSEPIIFTSELDSVGLPDDAPTDFSAAGLWGGLVILGKACINTDPAVQNIEGVAVTQADSARTVYGDVDGTGCNDADDSGILKYVSVRHCGLEIAANNELNGLSLGGVGSGTEMEYIEIIYNTDDGIEFFGGQANVKHAIVAFVDDDSYDIDQGNRMKGQFWFVLQSSDYPAAEKGGEWDGADSPLDGTPLQSLELYNATFIGVVDDIGKTNRAFDIRANGAAKIHNSIFYNFRAGVRINRNYDAGTDSYRRLLAGDSEFVNNHFVLTADDDIPSIFAVNGDTVATGATTSVEEDWIDSAAVADNNLIQAAGLLVNPLSDPASTPTGMLDPRPTIMGGAVTVSDEPADPFFTDVDYPGAFAFDNVNWMAGWSGLWSLGYLSDQLWTVSKDKAITLEGISVYPNPATVKTTVEVDGLDNSLTLLFVHDAMGREISREAVMPSAGTISVDLNLSGLPAGAYFVKVANGQKVGVQQVVKN